MGKKSLMVFKDTALTTFADPTNPFHATLIAIHWRGEQVETWSAEYSQKRVDRQFGKIRKLKDSYALKFDRDLFTIAELQSIVDSANTVETKTCEVLDFPMFVAIPDADYTKNAMFYLPNARPPELDENGNPVLDENGDPVTIKVKWNEWKDANHEHREVAGIHYIPLNSNTGGKECAFSLGLRLIDDGYTVGKMEDYPSSE
jgi:hypothetical protein